VLGEQKYAGDDEEAGQNQASLGFGRHIRLQALSIPGIVRYGHRHAPMIVAA